MVSERYQRLEKIGSGQMSIVWLALDTYTQQQVALKIMTTIPEDDRRNQKARERFHREIEIARSLQHPHILPIIDSGYTDYQNRRVPYLVSSYIPDGSLADFIKKRPPWEQWSLQQTADVVMQAAESLWYLHTRNPPVVHEDVKPGNFLYRLVEKPERIVYLYLCDFGISRWKQDAAVAASELLGTFAYMAPEQIERKVDCASDQYALAVMACFLLTSKLPLQAATNDLYPEAHLHDDPIPPSQLNPQRVSSPAIDEVILRALEKRPEWRFPSVKEFALALQRAIQEYVQEQANAPTEREDLSLADTTYTDERRVLSPMSPLPLEPDISIALDPPETNQGRVLDEPLPVRPQKNPSAPLKSEQMLFTHLSFQEIARIALPARPKLLTWTPDGTSLVCGLYGHAALHLSPNGVIQEIPVIHPLQACCCSPDGRVFAFASPGAVHFWDSAIQSFLPLILRFTVRTLEGMDWSRNDDLALWVNDQVLVYSLSQRALMSVQPPIPQRISTEGLRCGNPGVLRWSPDGAQLVAGASNGTILCWQIGSRQAPWQVSATGQKVNHVAWSPDGSQLVAAFRDNSVAGWDPHTHQPVFAWKNLPAMPRVISISTTNRIVIASSERRLLLGFPSDLYPPTLLPGQLLAAWSPTGPELAALDEQKEHVLLTWRE